MKGMIETDESVAMHVKPKAGVKGKTDGLALWLQNRLPFGLLFLQAQKPGPFLVAA